MTPPGHGGPSMFWMWGRGRPKVADSGPANSGLTGDPVIEGRQRPEGPKDLRGRWRNLKGSVRGTAAALPLVIRLVWDASPVVTAGLFVVTVVAGLIPAMSAYTSKLLVNAVVLGIEVHNHPATVADAVRFDFGPLRTPVFTAVPAFIADTRYGWRGYNIARWGSRLLRRMNYLVTLLTTDSYAKEVKLFGLGRYFIDRYRLIGNTYYGSQRRQVVRRYLIGFLWGNLSTIATSVTYLYVALQAIVGKLTLGDLTLYTTAAQSVQNSIQGILGGFSGMYEHNLYLSNLFELMETTSTLLAPAKPVAVPEPVRGEITFDHVSFAYPGAAENALTDLSFTVSAGETIAIVGRNGAGKTTLFKLICRLYDPSEGRILIDGIDIRDVDPAELRAQIGGMFQDYVTYQATAAENIGLGHLDAIADREAILKASRE